MKSDMSRRTFDARKHYNSVVMQQGRVQLDADWNEQQDILLHRVEMQAADIVGRSSAPTNHNGFEVMFTPDGRDLYISPGSFYVDGILCELEQEPGATVFALAKGQVVLTLAEVDNQPFVKQHWAEMIDRSGRRLSLFKIKDWQIGQDQQTLQQTLTLFSDQLNASEQDVDGYQVRPVMTYLTQPHYPGASALPEPGTKENGVVFLAYLDVWQRDITALDDPNILEVALGGADTAQRRQVVWQVKVDQVKNIPRELANAINADTGQLPDRERSGKERSEKERLEQERLQREHFELVQRMKSLLRIATFTSPLSEPFVPVPFSSGKLSAQTTGSNASTSTTSGYQGLENQLYHVEIHREINKNTAPTFKWARNNASLFVAAQIESGTVAIQGSGQGSMLGLTVGQYVELVDEPSELLGQPGHLAQIKQVNDITGQLTVNPSPPDNPKQVWLRLWNGIGSIDDGQNASNAGWIPLEYGLEIQFTQGDNYNSGDYWLIPARTATSQIEWPHTAPQPPLGIRHHYIRQAYLLRSKTVWLVQDYRRHFFPLIAEALHILDISWKNDVLQPHSILKEGLYIMLDGEPDPACAGAMQAAMIVSIESALPGGGAGSFIISGDFEINANIIRWHWHRDEKEGLIAKFFARFDEFHSDMFEKHEHHQRVRVTLKGHYIWRTVNGRRYYLDGQTFGLPGFEQSGYRPLREQEVGRHIDLHFPSGTGRPASDFESWFYLNE